MHVKIVHKEHFSSRIPKIVELVKVMSFTLMKPNNVRLAKKAQIISKTHYLVKLAKTKFIICKPYLVNPAKMVNFT